MSSSLTILLTLLFSSFFSGMEIAFVSANRLKIELENKQGKLSARILSKFIKKPAWFIGAMLVGNNVSLVIYGIAMAGIIEPVVQIYIQSHSVVLTVQIVISTLLVLVAAEFLPKTIFRIDPNRILNLFAIPAFIIYYMLFFTGIVWLIIRLSDFLLRNILGVSVSEDEEVVFGRLDLDAYLKEAATGDEEKVDQEIQIIQNVLDFSKIKIRECMVPRTEIIALPIDASIETLRKKFIETWHSKILVYKDSLDDIIGYVHVYDVFKDTDTLKSSLRPLLWISEAMTANELLGQFIQQRKSIAVVLDEFGGTSGIVTIEDVVEEIFGEIEDEHDVEKQTEKKIGENEFIFSARVEIDYLNDEYKFNIPVSDEYETLGGYIVHHLQNIPMLNDRVEIENLHFIITSVEKTHIEKVYLEVKEKEVK
ncbi:MAG: HlyC/CorC family transporter [Flavobacteriales bacterium]|nr:HlyC/CorC family transporter [Flavobacteriales bacterium]